MPIYLPKIYLRIQLADLTRTSACEQQHHQQPIERLLRRISGDTVEVCALEQRHQFGVRQGPLLVLLGNSVPVLDAKALMKEGGVIACEAPRHPWSTMHPATRAGLLEAAQRLNPMVLRWGK